MLSYAWENFITAAQGGEPETVPVALLVDCSFISSAYGMNTLDFFMYPNQWLNANLTLMARFPDVIFLPGLWVEYGVAAEASAFGTPVLWRQDEAPALRPLNLPLAMWGGLRRPDPYSDGMMAMVLRRYWNLEHNGELPEPHRIRVVAARGPFSIAAHVLGASAFMRAVEDEPDSTRAVLDVLEITTETTIKFLQAQLGCLREPIGIMLMDDTVGMLERDVFNRMARPFLSRVFDSFDGLIRIFHNNTPCRHLLPLLPTLNFEVFHASHQLDVAEVKAALGPRKSVMGNLPPLGVMAHGTPAQVTAAAEVCITHGGRGGGLILSAGGTLHADTPADNIDALVSAATG